MHVIASLGVTLDLTVALLQPKTSFTISFLLSLDGRRAFVLEYLIVCSVCRMDSIIRLFMSLILLTLICTKVKRFRAKTEAYIRLTDAPRITNTWESPCPSCSTLSRIFSKISSVEAEAVMVIADDPCWTGSCESVPSRLFASRGEVGIARTISL